MILFIGFYTTWNVIALCGTEYSQIVQTIFTFIQYCVHIIYILLFLCGNNEPNPGPIEDNAYTSDKKHLNVRSIRNKVEYLLYLVSDFDFNALLNLT